MVISAQIHPATVILITPAAGKAMVESIQPTNDAEAGGGAIVFFRHDSDPFSVAVQGWSPTTPAGILSALQGSFTLSVWVKTKASIGSPGDLAYNGSAVIAADVGGLANLTTRSPLLWMGVKSAFNTGGDEDDTLNSSRPVNDGSYHHIVVTRDQPSGNKAIYIDGVLDSTGSGTTRLLNDPQSVVIGGIDDAGNPTLGASSFYGGFDGEMDDLQIYSGVLSSNEIASLHDNPGSTSANVAGLDFNPALNTTNLAWLTGGDTDWFVETTNTQDGVSAAQSGSVTGNQSSTLSVTVTGPGTLTFYWSDIANDPNDGLDYKFYIDDPNDGDVADLVEGNNSWQSIQDITGGPIFIPAGQHTLNWTVYADFDTDPTQAGFLDQVSFLPDAPPVITENPFDQTNYPGYPVWLSASASGNPALSLGSGMKPVPARSLPGATSSFYILTNSGSVGVQGNYYAIATNPAGSANTTTAAVSFVSAPLPPDWSRAFKSPFEAVDNTLETKDFYYGCIVDTNGNLYVAAEFGGNTTVGSSNLNSGTGGDAAAIVKQSPTGAPLWAVGITNNGTGSSFALCVAPAPAEWRLSGRKLFRRQLARQQ